MDNLTHKQIEYWAKEYRRLRYALPRGTTFYNFLMAPRRFAAYAQNQLRDWRDNPRIMPIAKHSPILLN